VKGTSSVNWGDKKCTANLKGQCLLSRVCKRGNEALNLKKNRISYIAERMLCSQSGPCSTEFIYFVEYLPEINYLNRVASASYMCTRVVSLLDIQYSVTSKVEQQFRHCLPRNLPD
jgi:hypothetical protein